jgi:hypothetical protein
MHPLLILSSIFQSTQERGKWHNGIVVSSIQRISLNFGHFSFANLLLLNINIKNYNVFPIIDKKNSKINHHKTSLKFRNLVFSSIKNLLIYCHAHTPSFTSTAHNKKIVRSTTNVVTTMKKPHYLQITNHNINKKHNKCRTTTPFTPHDVQLSFVWHLPLVHNPSVMCSQALW